jgi:4-diphosphocytidyl-2C-methyl-D-erythritol kinase
MSGSGPTVFGLFPKEKSAAATGCFKELSQEYEKTYLVHPLND